MTMIEGTAARVRSLALPRSLLTHPASRRPTGVLEERRSERDRRQVRAGGARMLIETAARGQAYFTNVKWDSYSPSPSKS
jgi:hypothetical protein